MKDCIFQLNIREVDPVMFFVLFVLMKIVHSFRNLIAAVLALDRFIAITWPFKGSKFLTVKVAKITIWICILIALPRAIFGLWAGNVWIWMINPCSGKWQIYNDMTFWWFQTFGPISGFSEYWLHILTAAFVPTIISGLASIGLMISIKKAIKKRKEVVGTPQQTEKMEKASQKLLRSAQIALYVSIAFFVLQSTQMFDRFFAIFTGSFLYNDLQFYLRFVAMICTGIDLDVDFFLTVAFNRKYRKELKICCP